MPERLLLLKRTHFHFRRLIMARKDEGAFSITTFVHIVDLSY
jgi:hypothetical protein